MASVRCDVEKNQAVRSATSRVRCRRFALRSAGIRGADESNSRASQIMFRVIPAQCLASTRQLSFVIPSPRRRRGISRKVSASFFRKDEPGRATVRSLGALRQPRDDKSFRGTLTQPIPSQSESATGRCRLPTGPLTIADVDGVFLDREGGFLDRFAQGRMRVHGPAEVFAAPAEFHHRDDLRDQFRGGVRQD